MTHPTEREIIERAGKELGRPFIVQELFREIKKSPTCGRRRLCYPTYNVVGGVVRTSKEFEAILGTSPVMYRQSGQAEGC